MIMDTHEIKTRAGMLGKIEDRINEIWTREAKGADAAGMVHLDTLMSSLKTEMFVYISQLFEL